MAATADLAGEDAPALFTVGKDGAVFYWMYDPASPNALPTSKGYAQVPGKHRKRKAPDTDPIQPTTASLGGEKATVGDKGGVVDTEDDDHDSSNDDSSSGASSDGSGERAPVEAGHSPAKGASVEVAEDGTDIQASTSGRANQDQQQQTLSFAGEQSSTLLHQQVCHGFCNISTCCLCILLNTHNFVHKFALPCPVQIGPA